MSRFILYGAFSFPKNSRNTVSCTSEFDHTNWLWKKWELFSQTPKNYPIRSRGGCELLASPRDTVSRKKARSHKIFTNQKRKISSLRKQRDILHKHLENRISKAQIKIVNNLSETAKKLPFLRIGYERQRIVKKLQTLSNSPLKFHQCTVRRKTWVKGDREMFTNILGPWSPKSRHSTEREKGVKNT